MPLNNPKPGVDWVSEYQIAAIPWVTSSQVTPGQTKQHEFYKISKNFTIKNKSVTAGSQMAVSFTENGLKATNSNYFTLEAGESYTGEFRLSRLFVSGSGANTVSYELITGLTMVDTTNTVLKITSSNGYQGVG